MEVKHITQDACHRILPKLAQFGLIAVTTALGVSCTTGPKGGVSANTLSLAPSRSMAIALSTTPSLTEKFAAEELQRYVGMMTGNTIPIVDETRSVADLVFYVGSTTRAESHKARLTNGIHDIQTDSLTIDTTDRHAILVGGGDRGTLYAVYELLESQGCRWFQPGAIGEYVPRRTTLDIKKGRFTRIPVFAVREIGMSADEEEETLQLIDWCAKNRLNRLFSARRSRLKMLLSPQNRNAWEKRGGQVEWQHVCHNYETMVPPHRYFDTRPEYYSLYKGERVPIAKEGGNLCTENRDVERIVTSFITNWFSSHPNGSVVPMCPPDGAVKWCECEDCAELGGVNFAPQPEGSMTRRQVEFINRVAGNIRQDYPNRYILNLAYARYVMPYAGIKTAPNTIVQLAHGYAGNGHMTKPITAPCNAEARDIFREWANSGCRGFGIWDYFILQIPGYNGSSMTPVGFGNVEDTMVKYLASFDHPYKVYFTQAGNKLQESNVFLYYALARLLWQPNAKLADLRNDYAEVVFGEASKLIATYLRELDDAYDSSDWFPPIWHDNTVPSPKVFTPMFLDRAGRLLDAAETSIPENDARGKKALARMRRSLEYAAQSVAPKQLVASDDGVWKLGRGESSYTFNAGSTNGNTELIEYIRERALRSDLYDDALRRALFRCRTREEPIVWIENERVKVGVLPGVGGRIIRLIDRKTGRNMLYEPQGPSELEDPGAGYLVYGGYEEYTKNQFASVGWEIPMAAVSTTTPDGVALTLSAKTDGFALVRTLSLQNGASALLGITSRLTNLSESPRESSIRIHPMFKIGRSFEDVMVFCRTSSGEVVARELDSISSIDDLSPSDSWGAFHKGEFRGVMNTFSPAAVTPYLHHDRAAQAFNLELHGNVRQLAPKESLSVSHTYVLLSGSEELEREMPGLTRGTQRSSSLEPDYPDSVGFTNGVRGQGAVFGETVGLSFKNVPLYCDLAGTFECWVSPGEHPSRCINEVIFSVGQKNPDHQILAIRKGELVFYRTKKSEWRNRKYAAWCKVMAPIRNWQSNEWHHVAVAWSVDGGENEGHLVSIYIDGKPVESRYDATMLPLTGAPSLGIGYDTASRKARFSGDLDEVRIHNQPLLAEEVAEIYSLGMSGEQPAILPYTILHLPFEGTTTSATVLKATDVAEHKRRRELISGR